jgi:integrase
VLEAVLTGRSPKRKLYHAFFVLAFNTGCRRGELMRLTRKDVRLGERTLTLPQTKNGQVRVVALNDLALEALASLPTPIGADGRIFAGFTEDTVSRQFKIAAEQCGIEGAHLHTTRHTFASHQALNGASGRVLMDQLGHNDPRMVKRYQRLGDLQQKIALVNAVQLGGRKATTPEETSRQAG